jgi:DNA-binding transcriptional ArsR family regulator
MHSPPDAILPTLADPTRRAIFERLVRDGDHEKFNYGAAEYGRQKMFAGLERIAAGLQ